jgi:hypothetical protein
MQLLVENIALTLFRMVGQTTRDPVLRGLMPLFERDEARHVGLGVLYLPKVLPRLSRRNLRRLHRYQARTMLMVLAQGFRLHDDFARLGIDHRELNELSFRHQAEVFREIREHHGGTLPASVRSGLMQFSRKILNAEMDFLYPADEAAIGPWRARARRGLRHALDGVERALRAAA